MVRGGKKTPSVKRCIESWHKVMPDYEIKEWNETNFDLNAIPWTKEAVSIGKWSLASDYIRHYAIYNEGGIYMDTDVMVYKPFDEFLKNAFFTSVEYHPEGFNAVGVKQIDDSGYPLEPDKGVSGLGLLAALYGAEKGNPFIKECLDYFGERHYINPDGTLHEDEINPGIMAKLLVNYGFRYKDMKQELDGGILILPSSVFAGDPATRSADSYSMHFRDNSWKKKNFKWWLKDYIKSIAPWLFRR